jgi:hypothetical protein
MDKSAIGEAGSLDILKRAGCTGFGACQSPREGQNVAGTVLLACGE